MLLQFEYGSDAQFPHTRGDEPQGERIAHLWKTVSPHTWG